MANFLPGVLITLEVVLFLLLVIYIQKTDKSIKDVDAFGIEKNFQWVKRISYLLLISTYVCFVLDFFMRRKIHRSHEHRFDGINIVSMTLITILLIYVRKFQSIINIAKKMPVPIEIFQDNFQPVSCLGKGTSLFVILSKTIAMSSMTRIGESVVKNITPS
jgi:hypothetical protein